ncbi:MAG TPA: glycosyltransferase family 2 protein [Phycisphaerales bacterium]|nr:glycosyltransferase family 2 protein [Phycisphaerales bacterium]
MKDLCVVIINYRQAALTADCLRSLAPDMARNPSWCAVLADNCSCDGSAEELESLIARENWSWVTLVKSPVNGGFSAGNNIGFTTVQSRAYLLLNSDARVTPGALQCLLNTLNENPRAGLIGPRLQWPDGDAQISAFTNRNPVGEFLEAAGISLLDRLFNRFIVARPIPDSLSQSQWVSFACVLIRREVIDQIGLMDEGYFMYFEDIDYCRRAHRAGWIVLHQPSARVIHLRGGSSSVKSAIKSRARIPRYYYEARTRYFAKFYGGIFGVLLTNLCWLAGRCISWPRELLTRLAPSTCKREGFDNWTNFLSPMRHHSVPTTSTKPSISPSSPHNRRPVSEPVGSGGSGVSGGAR